MRTWGRVGTTWVEVSTDANGFDDNVWLTTLAQTFKLNLGESPFYANLGIPAAQSVLSQVQPDYYVNYIREYFAPQFATLLISKRANAPNQPMPTYDISITTQQGSVLNGVIAT